VYSRLVSVQSTSQVATIRWVVPIGLSCFAAFASITATSAQIKFSKLSQNPRSTANSAAISFSTPDRVEDTAWWPTKGTVPRSEYVGTSKCERCHPDKVTSQMLTEMAYASTRSMDPALLDGQPRLNLRQDPYDYEVARTGQTVVLTVSDGHASVSQRLIFAFGQGVVGHTFLYEKDGELYESHVSYYSAIKGLDLTTGHPKAKFTDLSQALGRLLDPQEAQRCFGCHTTASTTSNRFDPSQAASGVACEACHGPGSKHVQAMEAGEMERGKRSIVNPGNLDPASSVDFCGACHRTSGDVIQMNATGIVTVRFQPFRLEESRCWKGANKRLTCVTCHDPHAPLVQDSGHYDQVCLRCHSQDSNEAQRAHQRKVVCRVSKVNCASCHMPKFEIPSMHHAFTDHWIRIARENDPYPN
jgi:Cytochrome c554 and c-prime